MTKKKIDVGQCDGCGRAIRAGHPQGNDVVYCVDCHYKASQIRLQTMNHAAAMMNYAGSAMDEMFGLPARREITVPQPNYFSGSVDNSINIADSVVGVVNTGTIKNLNNSLNDVSVNNPELAARLIVLSHRIATKKELPQEAKEEGLEALTFLSEQAQKPENGRNKSMIKSAGKTVHRTLSLAADLVALTPLVASVIKDLI